MRVIFPEKCSTDRRKGGGEGKRAELVVTLPGDNVGIQCAGLSVNTCIYALVDIDELRPTSWQAVTVN